MFSSFYIDYGFWQMHRVLYILPQSSCSIVQSPPKISSCYLFAVRPSSHTQFLAITNLFSPKCLEAYSMWSFGSEFFLISTMNLRFISITVQGSRMFFYAVEEHYNVWMYQFFSIHSVIEGYFICFQVLAIINFP